MEKEKDDEAVGSFDVVAAPLPEGGCRGSFENDPGCCCSSGSLAMAFVVFANDKLTILSGVDNCVGKRVTAGESWSESKSSSRSDVLRMLVNELGREKLDIDVVVLVGFVEDTINNSLLLSFCDR